MKSKAKKLYIFGLVLLAAVIALPALFLHVTNISNYDLSLSVDAVEYTGGPIRPKVEVTNGPLTLEEGEDYTLEYKDNTEVGIATVEVVGKSKYRGSSEAEFHIKKGKQKILGDNRIVANVQDQVRLNQSARTDLTYKSTDENVIKVDEKGKVTVVAPGEATVEITAEETDSFRPAAKVVDVEITETEAQRAIRGTLAWAREIAADDSYTYGRGQCPACHGGTKVYDCIAFMTASFWHGGKVGMMERWCWNHNHTSVIRQAMIDSGEWEGLGNAKEENLQPGDVLFYYRAGRGRNGSGWFHVEIYNGDGQVVGAHTFGGKSCISVEPFNNYFRSYSDVYRYVGKGDKTSDKASDEGKQDSSKTEDSGKE